MGADRRGWDADPVGPGDSLTRRPTIRRALFAGLAALLITAASASCGGPPDGSAPAGNVITEGTPATNEPLDEVGEDEEDAVATSRPAQRSTSEEAGAGAEEREPAGSATETGTSDNDSIGDDAPAGSTGRLATDDDAAAGIAAAGEPAAAESIVSPDVPDIEMIDLSSGSTVSLRSVVSGETPLLFWFWSPL